MQRRVMSGTAIALFAGSLVSVGAACDDGGGDSTTPGLPDDVDIEQGEVPEGFPEDDVPLPDEPLSTGAALGIGNERNWTIVYGVDNLRRAAEGYGNQLERAGFVIEESFSTADDTSEQTSFTATSDDYIVTAFAGGIGGETALTVTVAPAAVDVP
ncbi:MAG: hypothetical protein ACRDY6_19850 [Acidimicrobiia bacterium]